MRILYVTTISLTMNSFFKPHIEMLVNEGNHVDIACNYNDLPLDGLYNKLGCISYQIDFSRSPLSKDNIKAYGQLKKIIEDGNYDIVHCHTPNASVITRLVCRKFRKKSGLKVFYTAHGFHFYKGAPKLNWLIYYPIEKFCSRYTDKLITINKEDYEIAKKNFNAKEVRYIPGVGIDLTKFENIRVDRKAKREEIGVPEDATVLITVGELSARKNQILILKAILSIKKDNIYYLIVGEGDFYNKLHSFVKKNGLSSRVFFLGYRNDVVELYKISDICCFASVHEGLPVALMEAMASKIPIICSKIRGNVDLINNNRGFLFDLCNIEELIFCINNCINNKKLANSYSIINTEEIKRFSIAEVLQFLRYIYFY